MVEQESGDEVSEHGANVVAGTGIDDGEIWNEYEEIWRGGEGTWNDDEEIWIERGETWNEGAVTGDGHQGEVEAGWGREAC